MGDQPIEVEVEDQIATVRIDRPDRKNAGSVAAANGLTDAWELSQDAVESPRAFAEKRAPV